MGLSDVLTSAVDTVFTVLSDFVCDAKYTVTPAESGWDESEVFTSFDLKVIPNGMSQNDLRNTKFFSQIAPTDTVAMVKGSEIKSNGIRVRASDTMNVTINSIDVPFEVIAYDTDPAFALYMILLREK